MLAIKEPTPDAFVPPFQREYAATVGVEVRPDCVCRAADTAPRVALGGIVAIVVKRRSGLFTLDALHVTTIRGMQGDLIADVVEVSPLHDIDLAIGGPVVAVGEPEGGPSGAADRGVLDVEDEEARVVGGFGFDAGGDAACCGVDVAGVDFEYGGGGAGEGEV